MYCLGLLPANAHSVCKWMSCSIPFLAGRTQQAAGVPVMPDTVSWTYAALYRKRCCIVPGRGRLNVGFAQANRREHVG